MRARYACRLSNQLECLSCTARVWLVRVCPSLPRTTIHNSSRSYDHGVRSTYTMSRAPIFIVVSLSQSFLLDGLSNIDKRTLENIKHRDTNIFPYRGEIHLKKGTRNCFIVHPVYLSLGNEFVKIGQTGEAAQCVQHLPFKRYTQPHNLRFS